MKGKIMALLCFLFFIVPYVYAQSMREIDLEVESATKQTTKHGFTALSIAANVTYENLNLIVDGKEYHLTQNHHFDKESISNLILFDREHFEFEITNKTSRTLNLKVTLFNGKYNPELLAKVETQKSSYKKDNCNLPALIDQDVWREGLDAPKPNPTTTLVSHLVIHHSATNNNVTDYLLAVRNIYLYHINYNGWDDVGYNYLISPDGTLFAGRDGQGKEDDNIKGAHFCGKNSYTMGVCLIGNYSEKVPSDSTKEKLAALLSWKSHKDSLQPLETNFHPKGSASGFELPVICGHRDGYKAGVFSGCQTECPGSYTYAILDTIRDKVAQRLINCGFHVGFHPQERPTEFTFQNGLLSFSSLSDICYQITDLSGKIVASGSGNQFQLRLPKGVFIINTTEKSGYTNTRKIVNY